jgi:AcrR family transcriptional regulator
VATTFSMKQSPTGIQQDATIKASKVAAPVRRRAGTKALTQARIIEAAVEFFAERGYERTSVASIAERAGVSTAAVFWHFRDKTALFQEVCRRSMVPFIEELAGSAEERHGRERLFAALGSYDRFVRENRETIETFVRWFLESPSLRKSLHGQLLGFHEEFAHEIRDALTEILGDVGRSEVLAAGLLSTMDGNLLLSIVDDDAEAGRRRSEALYELAELAVAHGTDSNG